MYTCLLSNQLNNIINIWWLMPLFCFVSQIGIEKSTFCVYALGLNGGVDVKWSRGVFVLELH